MFGVHCLLSLWQQDRGFLSVSPWPGKSVSSLGKRLGICKALLLSRPLGIFADEENGCCWNGKGAGDTRPRFLTGAASPLGRAPQVLRPLEAALPCPGLHLSVFGKLQAPWVPLVKGFSDLPLLPLQDLRCHLQVGTSPEGAAFQKV